MQIASHHVVVLDYSLKDDEGQLIDSSEGGEPLAYVHGTGTLIPGLEKALEGKATGDTLAVRLPPEEAYGERDDELIHPVPRDQLPDDGEVEVGMQFTAESDAGMALVTVVGVEGDTVYLDANHPLAGVALNFDVTVREVRPASEDELAQAQEDGHVHDESCDHG